MEHLPFWAGGLALTAVVLLHYASIGTQLAVSGRISALVDAIRERARGEREMSEDEMIAAMRAMTAAEFGEAALAASDAPDEDANLPTTRIVPASENVVFVVGLVIGGAVATIAFSHFAPTAVLAGPSFPAIFGSGAGGYLALLVGGVAVGVGTRMSGGCTSGHGLIGVPRLEPGSLLATASFFGAGVLASFALEVFR